MEALVEGRRGAGHQDHGRNRHCHHRGGGRCCLPVEWPVVLSATILSGVLSLLVSVKGLPEVKTES